MLNCTTGTIDDSNFGKPMPVIGLYIAAASLLCAIAMSIDAVKGITSKQFWIPNHYFSLNAASLTVVGVAIKLSVDLNSPMPSKIDQLTKLCTSAFICVMLANIQPSLGKLAKGELMANTIALSILVITSIVNLGIQLNTGVIHAFKPAHIVIIVMMSYLLMECIGTATYLPIINNHLHLRFEAKHKHERVGVLEDQMPQKLREYLMHVSMMAQSGCPHFVMARSSRNQGFSFGLVSALTFFVVLFATITGKEEFTRLNTCSGESDYGWSVLGILIAQTIALVVGLVAPISRHFYVTRAMTMIEDPPRNKEHLKEEDEEEDFWMQHVNETKENPILSYIEDRQQRPIIYYMKYAFRLFLFSFQSIFVDAFTRMAVPIMRFSPKNIGSKKKEKKNDRPEDISQEPTSLTDYILHVKGEEIPIKAIEKDCSCVTQRYIDSGKRGTPQNLIGFLKEHLSSNFGGIANFDDDEIAPLARSRKSPPNCWALAVLTLTSIATALPIRDPNSKKRLKTSVNEGLKYVKLVEDHMNGQHDFINIRAAATIVWQGLHRERGWLDKNLEKLAPESASPSKVVFLLKESAKECFSELTDDRRLNENRMYKEFFKKLPKWKALEMLFHSESEPEPSPGLRMIRTCKAVAAHSMYSICETMLEQKGMCQSEEVSNDVIFKKLCGTIADILGACFTNLRPCIVSLCERCPIEKRREIVFGMLEVFGETEGIMEILAEEGRNIPDVPSDERGFIDKWRSHRRGQNFV